MASYPSSPSFPIHDIHSHEQLLQPPQYQLLDHLAWDVASSAMESQRFLITGGCGLQGSDIALKLLTQYPSAPIFVASRKPTTNLFTGVTYIACDITSPYSLAAMLRQARPTVVFHCAGLIPAKQEQSLEMLHQVNVEGTENLINEISTARKEGICNVRAFLLTSSASVVMRDLKGVVGGDESMPIVSDDDVEALPYAKTKANAERVVKRADDPSPGGMRTVSIRPAVIYGERDNDCLPNMVKAADAGATKVQFGRGGTILSTTYVGNSTKAHLLACEKLLSASAEERDSVGGEAFFVTNGENYTFWDFMTYYLGTVGYELPDKRNVRNIPTWIGLLLAWFCELLASITGIEPRLTRMMIIMATIDRWYKVDKARRVLGWTPDVDWREGCRRGGETFLAAKKLENKEKAFAADEKSKLLG